MHVITIRIDRDVAAALLADDPDAWRLTKGFIRGQAADFVASRATPLTRTLAGLRMLADSVSLDVDRQ
ncbi:hypothetical protein GCM10010360_61300 [Streptomyces nogalater]